MMRSSSSKIQEKVEAVNSETPLENGLPPKEKLPTIQIDTVPSAPPSPDWSPIEESNEFEEPLDESEIQLELDTAEQEADSSEQELKEFVKTYVEDLLSQAMVLAEKKLQFAGVPDENEEDVEQSEPIETTSELVEEPEKEIDDSEIRAAAEKVVEEVISKATEAVAEKLENDRGDLSFPITFDEAPDDVKEVATSLVKEIVGKAVAMAEEKSVPTVPFNFEDVDLMKNSGPWYIRAREALMRLLRTACFCTPRRSDS